MIHEAYMPVYMGSRLKRGTDGRTDRGSTRGPRGPKKAFYRKSLLNMLLAISLTFVNYRVRISFKGSPLRGPLRKEHPHPWL